MQLHALLITGTLTGDLDTEDSTFTISGAAVMQPIGGLICDQDPAGEITVYNTHGWEATSEARVVAAWNEATGSWEAIQVDCP